MTSVMTLSSIASGVRGQTKIVCSSAAALIFGRNLWFDFTVFALKRRTGFPLGLENLENLEKWEGIFQSGKSQGILNRLEKSGKSQGKSYKILEN